MATSRPEPHAGSNTLFQPGVVFVAACLRGPTGSLAMLLSSTAPHKFGIEASISTAMVVGVLV